MYAHLNKHNIIASFSELCNCATRSHFVLYVHTYMYVSHA